MRKSIIALALVYTGFSASAAVLEDWQMEDMAGKLIHELANSAGTATWTTGEANISTTNGNLRFTQGSNHYRNADLTTTGITSGVYQLSFKYNEVSIGGGDASGATVGFGLRDAASGSDLFLVRVLRQNSKLLLQTRINNSNATYHDFGTTSSLPDTLSIRAVVDLDADLLDLYYAIGSGSETMVADIATFDGSLDQARMVGVLNATDFGATDFVDIEYLTLTSVAAGGNSAPNFDSDPVVAPGVSTNGIYSATLMDYATDPDGDPMTFWKDPGGLGWLDVATNGTLSGTAPATAGLSSWTVFVADASGGTNSATLEINVTASEFDEVPLTSENLYVLGAKFVNIDGNGMNFHRLDFAETYSNVNAGKAKTTTGVKLSFYTRSDTVNLYFDYMADDENRNYPPARLSSGRM